MPIVVFSPGLLSQITIDADKNMAGKALSNLGDVTIGANKLKTTSILLKELTSDYLIVKNSGDTAAKGIYASVVAYSAELLADTSGASFDAANSDGAYLGIKARTTGSTLTEIARLVGAASPYFKFTLPPVLPATARPGTPVAGHLVHNSTSKYREMYDGAKWIQAHFGALVCKAADETVNNSNVLQDDDELLFAMAANEVWEFEVMLRYISTAAADIQLKITVPAAAAHSGFIAGITGAASVVNWANYPGPVSLDGAGAPTYAALIKGLVINGANAGNVTLQWAQGAAEVSDTKVLAGSMLKAVRLK